jgi:hypothetical protein
MSFVSRCRALLLVGGFVGAASAFATTERAAHAAHRDDAVTVYMGECHCCMRWVEHLRKHDFTVRVVRRNDMEHVRDSLGVPSTMRGCHTSTLAGYTVEGHVPADVLRKLLRERPKATGIAVPGMPIGSPGMEMEGRPGRAYDVVLFDRGSAEPRVYAHREATPATPAAPAAPN